MSLKVHLTAGAVRDLENIHEHTTDYRSPREADQVLDKFEKIFQTLKAQPERGRHPPELLDLGILEYRELISAPYRLVYRAEGNDVYVIVIADGRRDMQSLLSRRLLEP
ncbi:MAG: type II toxin-antitoxin system RelE/ParE family toxin [Rhodospirillaceae bacterium]